MLRCWAPAKLSCSLGRISASSVFLRLCHGARCLQDSEERDIAHAMFAGKEAAKQGVCYLPWWSVLYPLGKVLNHGAQQQLQTAQGMPCSSIEAAEGGLGM